MGDDRKQETCLEFCKEIPLKCTSGNKLTPQKRALVLEVLLNFFSFVLGTQNFIALFSRDHCLFLS
jgi:hypothetical protein